MRGLPANPMSIRLTVTHRRLWWHIEDDDEQPEQWSVSADVWNVERCHDELRHVADISVALADLHRDWTLADSVALGGWGMAFIAETVLDHGEGRLLPEAGVRVGEGRARMLIVRQVSLTEPWRGLGLAGPLLAGALRTLAHGACLAACRVSPADFAGDDRDAAERASVRMGAILERIGFRRQRDVHIVDLKDPALLDARMDFIDRWAPPA